MGGIGILLSKIAAVFNAVSRDTAKLVDDTFANVIARFTCTQHCSYPSELFNHVPQSYRLGITSVGAYTFSHNVVPEALRLVNYGP